MQSFHGKRLLRWIAVASVMAIVGALSWAFSEGSPSNARAAIGAATALQTSTPVATPEVSPSAGQDVIAALTNAGQYTTLLQALQLAGLTDTLRGGGPVTLFAPTDAAFAKVPAATVNRFRSDPNMLKSLLQYHVVSGEHMTQQLSTTGDLPSVEGETLQFSMGDNGAIKVNDATIVQPDLTAGNGVIQGIDTVLVPTSLAAAATPGPSGSPSTNPSTGPSASASP